ncbi:MAG: hypothetical protein WDM92_07510 [Caulobacteraceae bacterium]
MLVFGSTQTIPQLLQQVLGYTATNAGFAMTLGGIATPGDDADRRDPGQPRGPQDPDRRGAGVRVLRLLEHEPPQRRPRLRPRGDGATVPAPAAAVPVRADPDRRLRGPEAEDTNQASALLNVFRNHGGSFGISLVQTLVQQRQQFHQARLVEA